MNDLDIFCFTSAARTKSFSITARELMISQQAVSKHIKNLEDELGYQLIFRDITPLSLTKAGSMMLAYFSERNRIKEFLINKYAVSESARSFTIACSQWVGCPGWFSDAIRIFCQLHPDASLRLLDLDAAESAAVLSNHSIDFFLTSSYMAKQLPASWRHSPLAVHPLYLIRSRKIPEDRSQYYLYPFFAPSAGESNEHAIRTRVRNTCRKLGFIPQNIICCNDMGTVILNVLLNNGLTIGSYAGNTEEYIFEQTELTVDLVTCMPYHSSNPYAEDFRMLLEHFPAAQTGEDCNE